MKQSEFFIREDELKLEKLNLPKEKLELVVSELGNKPSLYSIVTTFYRYGVYQGLDYLYDNYGHKLCDDYFMESIFSYLARLSNEEKIEYFYNKSKSSIEQKSSFDRFQKYKNFSHDDDNFNYSDQGFVPLFDEGSKILCTKKKAQILKKLYSYGFRASLNQLKAATRTQNEEVFYVVFEELNKKVIADYVPKIVEELCYYSKLEPIKFLFEKIGVDYITQDSLNNSLINSVNCHSKWSKLDIFKYILELGADLKYNKYEVFENIFGYNHTDVLRFLYENESQYNFLDDKNYDFKKYVEIAIKYNKIDIISYLITNERYKNKDYNLMNDKLIIEKYCGQFIKHKEVLEYLIKEIYGNKKDYLNELKLKFLKQRKLQEFLSSLL